MVLQDEPLDVVSPAPFLLHSFGLGGPEGEGAGVIMTGLKPSSVRRASAEEGRGQRACAGGSVRLPRLLSTSLRGAHNDLSLAEGDSEARAAARGGGFCPQPAPQPAPHLDVVLLLAVLVVCDGEARGFSGALDQHQGGALGQRERAVKHEAGS